MPTPPQQLVREQYQLRATFFSSQLEELGFLKQFQAIEELSAALGASLDWSKRSEWGIQGDVWNELVTAAPDKQLFYFLHPGIFASSPEVLRYYRCINLFPQKGLQRITN